MPFRALIIDDEPYRHPILSKLVESLASDVDHAFAADSALKMMESVEYDLAFFDHDLGTAEDASWVAGQILWNRDTYLAPKSVIVHSMNLQGAKNIASKFTSANVPCEIVNFAEMLLPDFSLERILEKLAIKPNS